MDNHVCENCGGQFENNGITLQCPYCDNKIVDIIEKMKAKEIERIVNPNSNMTQKEPQPGLLTDDEILKYAPRSITASKIRIKRRESTLSDKIKVHGEFIDNILIINITGTIFGGLFLMNILGKVGLIITLILFTMFPIIALLKIFEYI